MRVFFSILLCLRLAGYLFIAKLVIHTVPQHGSYLLVSHPRAVRPYLLYHRPTVRSHGRLGSQGIHGTHHEAADHWLETAAGRY